MPGTHLLENMRQVIHRIDFFGSPFNTVVVSVAGTVLVLFFDSLAAFAFAKYEFPVRKPLFGILSATYVIPGRLSLVAQFVTMADFGWAGSLKALVIPGAANAFGIFWMRQYAQNSLPDELLDACRIDGAGFLRLYRQVALPPRARPEDVIGNAVNASPSRALCATKWPSFRLLSSGYGEVRRTP